MENSLSFCRKCTHPARVIQRMLLIPLLILSMTACVNVPPEASGGAGRPAPVNAIASPAPISASEVYEEIAAERQAREIAAQKQAREMAAAKKAMEMAAAKAAIQKAIKPSLPVSAPRPAPAASPSPENPALAPIAAAPAAPVVKGSLAYFVPKKMVEKKASHVDLWIDRNTSEEQLKQELATKLNVRADHIRLHQVQQHDKKPDAALTPDQMSGEEIPIGGWMIAELLGKDDFKIEPEGPQRQPLNGTDRATWNWRVTPQKASDTLLDIKVWIDPNDGKPWKESYHEAVLVEATPQSWNEKLYKIAQDLNAWLTLLGIGGIGGLFAWLSRRKTK